MRIAKQLIIGLIYLSLWAGLGYGAYDIATVDATCTDGVQNQQEQGVDCGPVCGKLCDAEVQALQVKSAKVLQAGSGYDLVAEIYNPNLIYGSGKVSYTLTVQDAQGGTLSTENASIYILPRQTRYVIKVGLRVTGVPVTAKLAIIDAEWQKVNFADTVIDFSLRREQYVDNAEQGALFEGVLFNNSDFDFGRVDVAVLLTDSSGQIIAVNPSVINTFVAKTERVFTVRWPFPVSAANPEVTVQASTNVFDNANFIKSYGTPEKIKKFY